VSLTSTIPTDVEQVGVGEPTIAFALRILQSNNNQLFLFRPVRSACLKLQAIGFPLTARTIARQLLQWPWQSPEEIAVPSMSMALVPLTEGCGKSTAIGIQNVRILVPTVARAMPAVQSLCGRAVAGMHGPRTRMVCTGHT